jgi:hypothetical protein
MKKLAAVLTAIGLATLAPLAGADTAQLELMPKVGGAEFTLYLPEASPAAIGSSNASDEFFYRHTGGISPQ